MLQISKDEFYQYTDLQDAEEFFANLIEYVPSKQTKELIEQALGESEMNQFNQEGIKNKLYSENIFDVITSQNQLGRMKWLLNNQDFTTEIVPKLLHFLNTSEMPLLVYQSIFILSNVKREQSNLIIQNKGIITYLCLLKSEHYQIINQTFWAINQIFSSNFDRDYQLFEKHFLKVLINLEEQQKITDIKLFARTCSSICKQIKNINYNEMNEIKRTIKCLSLAIDQFLDVEIIIDLCQALTYFTDFKPTHQFFIELGVIKQMISMINEPHSKVVFSALVLLNNLLVNNCDGLAVYMINNGFFLQIKNKIASPEKITPFINLQVLRSILLITKDFKQPELIENNTFIFQFLFTQLSTNCRTLAIETLCHITQFKLKDISIINELLDSLEFNLDTFFEPNIKIFIILQNMFHQNQQEKYIDLEDLTDDQIVEYAKDLIAELRDIYSMQQI